MGGGNINQDFEIQNAILNTVTDTPVIINRAVPYLTINCQSSPTVDIYMRRNAADTSFWKISAGTTLSININLTTPLTLYFRSATGTPTVQIMAAIT